MDRSRWPALYRLMRPRGWRAALVVLLVFGTVALFTLPLSLFPEVEVSFPLPLGWAVHLTVFMVLTVALAFLAPRAGLRVVVSIALLLAFLAEGAQAHPSIERTAQFVELGYNVLGVAIGAAVALGMRGLQEDVRFYREREEERRSRQRVAEIV